MVILVLDACPPGLRGEVTRWLTPVGATIFVGHLSTPVRDRLWAMCVQKAGAGRLVMVWSARVERGFRMRLHAQESLSVVDLEGIVFPAVRDAAWSEAVQRFRLVDEDAS